MKWRTSRPFPLGELKTRLPRKLMPLVKEFKEKIEKLSADQGGRLVLEKGAPLAWPSALGR